MPSERTIVFAVGAVQFVNILDFVIVMPLGPDFAGALGIPVSRLGYIGGSYTAAASVAGLVGALFLDRLERRKALGVAMLGLVLGTLSGAFARGMATLMLARIVAGLFGGPATSLSYSIIADTIPPERRGKAMGAVMGAFSIASILGVPAGLELAKRGGWRTPFIAAAVLGAALGLFAFLALPDMSEHRATVRSRRARSLIAELADLVRFEVGLSLAMTFMVMAASFILIPNISPYVLGNLHYPRARLSLLYLAGGLVSFVTMRATGRLVDRFGSARVGTLGTLVVATIIYTGFIMSPPPIPVVGIFVGFMLGMGLRNVAYNTLTSKVPRAHERARFSSVQSAVQHLASALAAFVSSMILSERADQSLVGIATVGWISMIGGLSLPPMLWWVESRVSPRA